MVPTGQAGVFNDLLEVHVFNTAGIPVGPFDGAQANGGIDVSSVHGYRRAAHGLVEQRLWTTCTHFLALQVFTLLNGEVGKHDVRALVGPTYSVLVALVGGLLDQLADAVIRVAPHRIPGLF